MRPVRAMQRSILFHSGDGEAAIDGYNCSRCAWFYRIKEPTEHDLDEEDTRRACEAFVVHECGDHPRAA